MLVLFVSVLKRERFERIVEMALASEQSDHLKLASLKFFEKMILGFISTQKLNENLFIVGFFALEKIMTDC
jgi:hypothetical protein